VKKARGTGKKAQLIRTQPLSQLSVAHRARKEVKQEYSNNTLALIYGSTNLSLRN